MEKDDNPFLVAGYRDAAHFCDRKSETAVLKRHIKNNVNTTLFAIRRLGKTGLIHHVFEDYKNSQKIACLYVDILNTLNLKGFTNQLATVIYNRFPENKTIGKRFSELIKLLRPLISFDVLTGAPELSFEMSEPKQYERTIQQLFTFLDNQKIKVIFAIDEFQQILQYPEQNTEALLRSHIQQLKNTNFIFCGSNQKMMHEIFNNAKRPFYASCATVDLDHIERPLYEQFIVEMFKKHKRNISAEAVAFIMDWTTGHTFYTQYFCNILFSRGLRHIQLSDALNTAAEILKVNETIYYQYRNLLTTAQWNLLHAIARENKLYRAHSKDFINKYGLGTSSMVTRGLESLLAKEMIYFNAGVKKPYYEIYDKYLMRWLQH